MSATQVADVLDSIPAQQADLRAMIRRSARALLSLSWGSFGVFALALFLFSTHTVFGIKGSGKECTRRATREATLYYMSIAAAMLTVSAALVQLLTTHVQALWGVDVEAAVDQVRPCSHRGGVDIEVVQLPATWVRSCQ